MMRNREIKWFIVGLVAVIALMLTIAGRYSKHAFVLVGITALMLSGLFIGFTIWRYREIRRLAAMLDEICRGNITLDVRDNVEGELSILKNNIYKVTTMLSRQGQLLKKDKVYLADALSDISHQLKTPLTSMTMMTELLTEDNLTTEERSLFLNNINQQLDRIGWLITALLKLSKIDAGVITFKTDVLNVEMVIKKAAAPFLILMELKNQKLKIQGNAETVFIGDFNWTVEAISNILKNCVEHTPVDGVITITYGENPIYTEITIADNGEGIDKADLPYIFQRFYRGKNAGEDSVGIGLAMARSILLAQKGDVTAESIKNEGSRFCIKFYRQIV